MGKYSRTRKYEELRNRMQNENETDITNREIAQVNRRMNELNGTNLSADPLREHNPTHARFHASGNSAEEVAVSAPSTPTPDFDSRFLQNNENYTSAFNNEYLNEYIREAKQYNVDHGNALSGNTDINILRTIRGEKPAPAPVKPYTEESKKTEDTLEAFHVKRDESAFETDSLSDFLDSLEDTRQAKVENETTGMTREDIAAEVQNLIQNSGRKIPSAVVEEEPKKPHIDTASIISEAVENSEEQKTRQQLLQETTQMREQLNDYQDDLSEVSNKMKRTNHILNIVLIVLIIALSVVLLVVVYWILQSRGVF